jgi:uncharacterized protein YtpQ (UPF0354 family)
VRDDIYVTKSALQNVFPRFYAILPSVGIIDIKLKREDSPVESLFAGDLVILYGRDLGTHYQLISQKALSEAKLTTAELHEIAVANLSKTEKEIRLHKAGDFSFLICDGNLEASLLLHTGIWDYVQEQIGGDVLTSVPARDLLLIAGTTKSDISALKRKTCEALEKANRPLSSKLFLRIASGWKEYAV